MDFAVGLRGFGFELAAGVFGELLHFFEALVGVRCWLAWVVGVICRLIDLRGFQVKVMVSERTIRWE